MTLALGNMGIFGNSSTSMSEPKKLVNEAMSVRMPLDKMAKAQITKYLDAFEIVGAVNGLNLEQQEAYSMLLKYC